MAFRASLILLSLAVGLTPTTAIRAQTKATDKVPPFALSYFVGEWTFDWTLPETVLGPAGDLAGKETFRLLEPHQASPTPGFPALPATLLPKGAASEQAVESWIDATGPSGKVKTRALITYDPITAAATRHEIDAAGGVLTKRGKITGDLGGIYSFTWETEPLQRAGQRVRLRGRTVAFSPQHYREFLQYAVDGETFVAYGQPWYRKVEQ
jgi:hypothetical protein